MNTKKVVWASLGVVVVVLVVVFVPAIVRASTVVRSKSNICNNRAVVISSTVNQPNAPDGGHLWLLDTETGVIWDYSVKALSGSAQPKYVGTMQYLGDPAIIEQKYKMANQ
jgi:hypothetical protein